MQKFWDIESYKNFFCVGILDESDFLEMHYMVNNEEDRKKVLSACKDSGYKFNAYDLFEDATVLIEHFRKQIPTSGKQTLLADFLGIEEKEVKPKEDDYIAYNNLSYDIPMIDKLLSTAVSGRVTTSTETMRLYSDELIERTTRGADTRPYERYAGQVDSAMLNEKMIEKGRPTVGLKTLIGTKGGSIIESEANKTGWSDDVYKDTLYNINDCSELKDVVFVDLMQQVLNIRKGLLRMYPHLAEKGITPNSTSAKFVENIVSPDKPIDDFPTVSLIYPAKHVAEAKGVKQKDILEYTKEWYIKNVYQRILPNNPYAANANLAKFMSIYSMYNEVRGSNWNDSSRHFMAHGIEPKPKAARRELMATYGTYLPLLDQYGNDTGTHVNFSLGGIHGAEINMEQLEQDRSVIAELRETYKYISAIPKGLVAPALLNLIRKQSRTQYKGYPQHLSHEIPLFYKNTEEVDEILPPEEFTPFMFNETKNSNKEVLLERYRFTSTGMSVHQDFAGYYPMLMINMGVFYDGNGKDVYAEVYNKRIAIKKSLKSLKFMSKEWIETNITQEGYKLILNSASGVLDGSFDTNLRANNKAMAMRITGQLMTYIIAAALAIEGARIPSSNTDGIYVFNIDYDLNKSIVDRELKELYVEIDPEPVYLVSKDTNNRMELEEKDGKWEVVSARGGTLTSWGGAVVSNRLTHPALVDRVMTIYLQNENIVNKDVDKTLIRKAIDEYQQSTDKRNFVYMASWIMRSTSGSVFVDSDGNTTAGTLRSWLAKDGVKMYRYGTRKASPSKSFDAYANELFEDSLIGNPEDVHAITDLGLEKYFTNASTVADYRRAQKTGESVSVSAKMKISNLSDTARLYINNHSILKMSDDEIDEIYEKLDIDEYVDLIAQFCTVWHNEVKPSWAKKTIRG